MNIDDLVKLITEEVLKRLNIGAGGKSFIKKILILSTASELHEAFYEKVTSKWANATFLDEFRWDEGVEAFDHIVLPRLSNRDLVNIALGSDEGNIGRAVIEGLLRGKRVIVIDEGIYYKKFKQQANTNFYQMMETYENKLVSFGIHIIGEEKLLSYMEDEMRQEGETLCQKALKAAGKGNESHRIEKPYTLEKKIIVESDMVKLFTKGYKTINIGKKTIITPLAADYIRMNHINIHRNEKKMEG